MRNKMQINLDAITNFIEKSNTNKFDYVYVGCNQLQSPKHIYQTFGSFNEFADLCDYVMLFEKTSGIRIKEFKNFGTKYLELIQW